METRITTAEAAEEPEIELSIVATLYLSEPYIEEFAERAMACASQVATRFEIVLVNDCSPDGSLDLALAVQKRFPQVRIVDLARNAGHHRAMMTGLCFARGKSVFLIDVDLEEAPEWLIPFGEAMAASRADVVYGVQRRRKGTFVEKSLGSLFYRLVNLSSGETFQTDSVTARLMSRRYVRALTAFREREFAIGDLWVRTGFVQMPHLVDKKSREGTSYTFYKRLRNAVIGITSTSTLPLTMIFLFGMAVSAMSFAAIFILLVRYFFFSHVSEGWTSLILSVWLLGGATLMSIGVIGMYLARIFQETKRRPYVVIRDVFDPQGATQPSFPLDAAGQADRQPSEAGMRNA